MEGGIAPVLPTIEPANAIAGDTWSWTHANNAYPIAEGWALSYSIRGLSAPAWSTAYVTDDGIIWTIAIPATITAAIAAGSYAFERHYTGSGTYAGRRFTDQLPRLDVIANAATAAAGDLQSRNEKMLAAIASLLYPTSGVVSDVASYTIHSRQITRMNKLELEKWYGLYAQRVKREKNGGRNASIHIGLSRARD